jgi:hypothetical protein
MVNANGLKSIHKRRKEENSFGYGKFISFLRRIKNRLNMI